MARQTEDPCNIHQCEIYHAIEIIKSRYSAVVIFSLEGEPKPFSYLSEEFDYLTNAQLTRTLKQLIEYNVVIKDKTTYSLSTSGIDLVPVLRSLETWHYKYNM